MPDLYALALFSLKFVLPAVLLVLSMVVFSRPRTGSEWRSSLSVSSRLANRLGLFFSSFYPGVTRTAASMATSPPSGGGISVSGSGSNTSNNVTYTPRGPHDIYHAAFLLRQKLPADLVPSILDSAEYWLSSVSRSRYPLIIRWIQDRSPPPDAEGSPAADGNGVPCLISANIAAAHPTHCGWRPVRKVVFTIVARDQGWSNYSADHGTRRNAWSWFEADVLSPAPSYDEITAREMARARARMLARGELQAQGQAQDQASNDGQDEARGRAHGQSHTGSSSPSPSPSQAPRQSQPRAPPSIPPPPPPSRRIATNIHAGRDWEMQVVTWHWDADDADEREWVRGLRPGQRVRILARVLYPGWENRVQSAKVEVFTAAVR